MSQEKLQTMSMQNFGGVKEMHYGIVQVVNAHFSTPFRILHFELIFSIRNKQTKQEQREKAGILRDQV